MSLLSAMTIAREIPLSVKMLATVAAQDLEKTRGAPATPAATKYSQAAVVNDALSALLAYIPTETTAIYLAFVSAFPAIQPVLPKYTRIHYLWVIRNCFHTASVCAALLQSTRTQEPRLA